MSKWICNDCGATFDEPKLHYFDGEPFGRCPDCDSEDYEEARTCEVCGDEFPETDTAGCDHCVCSSCRSKHDHDLPLLIRAGRGYTYDYELPALVRHILSDAEINAVLERELERKMNAGEWNVGKYMHSYRDEIADEIGEELKQ